MTWYGCQTTESFKLRLVRKLDYGFDTELQAVAEKIYYTKNKKIDSEIYVLRKSNISLKTCFFFPQCFVFDLDRAITVQAIVHNPSTQSQTLHLTATVYLQVRCMRISENRPSKTCL